MNQRTQFCRLGLWLSAVPAFLFGIGWVGSYFVQVSFLTEPDADLNPRCLMEIPGSPLYLGFDCWLLNPEYERVDRPWAMFHQLARGVVILDVPVNVDLSQSSRWRVVPTLDMKSRHYWDWLPRWPCRLSREDDEGGALFPLWLPTVCLAAAAWCFHRFSAKSREARRARIQLRRSSPVLIVRVVCALAIAGLLAHAAQPGLELWRYVFLGSHDTAMITSVNVAFVTLVAFDFVIPCLGAVFVFQRLSWCRVRIDRPECVYCRYNLTGNESGTCPECGNPIHPRQAAWLGINTNAQRGSST